MRIVLLLLSLLCLPTFSQAEHFSVEPLPLAMKQAYLRHGLWRQGCPLSLERLQRLTLSYYDFDGASHNDGELIVMDAVADNVVALFQALYRRKFPMQKIQPTSVYGGDDNASMADNNTSAFNCRNVTGGTAPSMHAYGLAIDINTVQNPFVQRHAKTPDAVEVLPPQGIGYLNRANRRPGMAEEVVQLFARHGFPVWGGTWNDPIDWQHFQPSRTMAKLLTAMTPAHARELFALYVKYPAMLTRAAYDTEGATLVTIYHRNPARFMQLFHAQPGRLAALEPAQAVQYLSQRVKGFTKVGAGIR